MYDFDNDGYITPEDVRLMLSYLPIKKNGGSLYTSSEGMLSNEEGSNRKYDERMSEQEDIKQFVHNIFHSGYDGIKDEKMCYR